LKKLEKENFLNELFLMLLLVYY